METKRKFGIELEFSSEFDAIKNVIKNVIQKVYGYNKLYIKKGVFKSISGKKWILKEDHSTAAELTAPASSFSDLHNIMKVIKYLKKSAKCKITDKDSMHIHISANNVLSDNLIAA